MDAENRLPDDLAKLLRGGCLPPSKSCRCRADAPEPDGSGDDLVAEMAALLDDDSDDVPMGTTAEYLLDLAERIDADLGAISAIADDYTANLADRALVRTRKLLRAARATFEQGGDHA